MLSPTGYTPCIFSGLYLKRNKTQTVYAPRTTDGESVHAALPLELSSGIDDDDLFTMQVPDANELADVHFVLNNVEALTIFVDAFKGMSPGFCLSVPHQHDLLLLCIGPHLIVLALEHREMCRCAVGGGDRNQET